MHSLATHFTTANDHDHDPLEALLDGGERRIAVDDRFRTAVRELQDSSEPGDILAIGGKAIFLTDTEREAVRHFNPLKPSDFGGDLVTWRQHLRDLIAL